jgi:hypothetical protein
VNQFERQERQNVRFSPQCSLVWQQIGTYALVQISDEPGFPGWKCKLKDDGRKPRRGKAPCYARRTARQAETKAAKRFCCAGSL